MHLFNDLWASFIYVFSLGTMVQDLCSKQLKGTMAQLISLLSLSLKLQPCPKSRNKSSPKSKKKKKTYKRHSSLADLFCWVVFAFWGSCLGLVNGNV